MTGVSEHQGGDGGDKLKLSCVLEPVTSLRDAATFGDKTFMVRDVQTNFFRSSLFADPQSEFSKLVQFPILCTGW